MKKLATILLTLLLCCATPAFAAWPNPNNIAQSGTNSDITSLTALTGAQTGMFSGGVQTITSTGSLSATSASQVQFNIADNITLTLPSASACPSKIFMFSGTGAHDVTLNSVSSQSIGGAGTSFNIPAGASLKNFGIISDGSNWQMFVPCVPFGTNINSGAVLGWDGTGYRLTSGSSVAGAPLLSSTPSNGSSGAIATWGSTVYTTSSISSTSTLNATSSKYILATGVITIHLTPTANKEWIIFNNDSNTKTIDTTSGSLLGTGSGSMTTQNSCRHYFSDGTNVYLVSSQGS